MSSSGIFVSLAAALILLPCCSPESYEFKKFLMDTEVSIIIEGVPEQKASEFAGLAFQEIEMLDKLFNWRDPESRLSKLNKEGFIKADKTLDSLIKKSTGYSILTGGAFDVTVQPLVELWNIPYAKTPPADTEIKKVLRRVNFKLIRIGKRTIHLYNGAKVDLGGMAKGQAVDSAIEVLKACGVKNALINAGGNIRCTGSRTWNIGIRHPRGGRDKVLGVLKLKDVSLATSGDYERFFEYNGKRYNHIIDPKTGYPAEKCVSVTVIAPSAVDADALSTSFFVLGPQKSAELAHKLNGIEYIFVTQDGNIILSQGLSGAQLRF